MGTTQEAFTLLEANITAIEESELLTKNRTMNAIAGETLELIEVSQEDRPHFKAMPRFDIGYIDTFPSRFDAFLHCYAEFEEVALDKSEALTEWNELEPSAYVAKKKILRRLHLIAEEKGDTAECKELNKIAVGRGREDLTMDFLKLAGKARLAAADLATLNYNEDEIVSIETTFENLKRLLGPIQTPNKEVEKRKLMMEKAYTYFAQAEKAIKNYGTMIFEDTEREDLYKSKSRQMYAKMAHKDDDQL